MTLQSAFAPVNLALCRLTRIQITVLALLGVWLVAAWDRAVGFEISLSLFYLVPISLAAWYNGKRAGLLIALISAIASLTQGMSEVLPVSRTAIMVWNVGLRLGFMIFVVYLLDSLHVHLQIEQDMARSDSLTGLFNRRAFVEHLQYCLDLAMRDDRVTTLAYIDLDNFKQLNDRRGHAEGDRVLQQVAGILKQSVRRTDMAARVGGDEFVLVLPGADQAAARAIIETLRKSLQGMLEIDDSGVTCSIGCVTFEPPPPVDADTAIRSADEVMYQVKSQGKNGTVFELFDPPRVPVRRETGPDPRKRAG